MTRTLSLILATICAMSLTSCAGFGRPSAPDTPIPPRREMPATARQACQIPRLPAELAWPTLKLLYASAAAEILRCDVARQTAVDVHDGEHADEEAWLRARP